MQIAVPNRFNGLLAFVFGKSAHEAERKPLKRLEPSRAVLFRQVETWRE